MQDPSTVQDPPAQQPTPPPEDAAPAQAPEVSDPNKFLKADVTNLFELLGYAEAKGWSPARIGKKIASLVELEKDPAFVAYRDKLPEIPRAVYDRLLSAAKAEASIELLDGQKEPKPKKEKKKREKKAARGGPGGPPRSREGVERDAFGSSVGSRGYDAMKVLTREEPMKVADIVVKSGHGEDKFIGVFYNFLNDQVKKGNVKKSDKGYTLTAAGEKLKTKHAEAKAGTKSEPEPTPPAPTEPAPIATPSA